MILQYCVKPGSNPGMTVACFQFLDTPYLDKIEWMRGRFLFLRETLMDQTADFWKFRCLCKQLRLSIVINKRLSSSNKRMAGKEVYTVRHKKRHPFYFCKSSVKSRPILIIFGTRKPEEIWHQMIYNLTISPQNCRCTTL